MRRFALPALMLFVGAPGLVAAQGFGIYEQGTCSMGRAGTGVALPCADGSAMFFNPAGLAGLTGRHLTVGTTLLDVKGGFTDDIFQHRTDLNNPLLAIPEAYISYAASPKLGLGVSLFAPYGLETQWPLSFDGRFAGYKNIIRSIYLQPTVAYQVNPWLKLGAGLDIIFGSVELNQRLDLAQQVVADPLLPPGTTFAQFGIPAGTDFANAHLTASQTTMAAHFGAMVKITDQLSLGGRYLMRAKFNYSGTATFTEVPTNLVTPAVIQLPGGPPIPAGTPIDALLQGLGIFSSVLVNQPVATTLRNPEQLVLGVAYKVRPDWTLFGDYQLTWWDQLSALTFVFQNPLLDKTLYENYGNTNAFRFGAEWAKDAMWTFRIGYLHHNGAAPAETVTPLLPEGERNEFTGGVTVKLGQGLLGNLAYQYIRQDDRRGRTREPVSGPATTGLNNGLYTFYGHLFGVSLSYAY